MNFKVVQYQAQGPNNVVKLRRRIHQRVGLDALVLGRPACAKKVSSLLSSLIGLVFLRFLS